MARCPTRPQSSMTSATCRESPEVYATQSPTRNLGLGPGGFCRVTLIVHPAITTPCGWFLSSAGPWRKPREAPRGFLQSSRHTPCAVAFSRHTECAYYFWDVCLTRLRSLRHTLLKTIHQNFHHGLRRG